MIGDRLGKWLIHRELGRGGMGRVYLAQAEIGGSQAAVKILAAELAQDAGFLHRFQREIDTLSQLNHPSIVRLYEAGFENGVYFYAMEYVEGRSFEELLAEQGRLPWLEVLDAALQICPALKHVHDHGVIHRDIKPPNLMRGGDGAVKLMDFGIAKVFASQHLTATGGIVGTAEYLSPEQAAGKPVSKRSDLYSLGVVLYTMLTGRTPFDGTTFVELLHKHRYGQFDRPQRLVPELPHELDDIVCQLLEKDPSKRPADCLVLGRQLDSLRRKLERKSQPTQAGDQTDGTVTDNRVPALEMASGPGAATLMSRLVREELERQNRGGWSRHLNRAWILLPLLIVCVGILVWTFWPDSAETLFLRGSDLMASAELADKERAWSEYFEKLEQRFPDHPYQDELKKFRAQLVEARSPAAPGEAQRLYNWGEQLALEGKLVQAREIWKDLARVFNGIPSEQEWVDRAQKKLTAWKQVEPSKTRQEAVRAALERAKTLPREQAEEIWNGLERLYATDADIQREVSDARTRGRK